MSDSVSQGETLKNEREILIKSGEGRLKILGAKRNNPLDRGNSNRIPRYLKPFLAKAVFIDPFYLIHPTLLFSLTHYFQMLFSEFYLR